MFDPQTLSAQQSASTAISSEISSLANNFYTILTDDRVMRSVDLLGLLLSTLIVCIWCLQTYKAFKKQGLRPKVAEIVLPILMIGLLLNNAKCLKELTFATENTLNSIKAPVGKVMNEGYRSPILPVTYTEQNYKSTGRSGIPIDNHNVSAEDTMINDYVKELARKYHNYYSIK